MVNKYISCEPVSNPAVLPLRNGTPLLELDILDSLAVLKLALFLEPRFGIVLAPAEPIPESFATVGAVCAYLRGWQQAERMQVGAYAGS